MYVTVDVVVEGALEQSATFFDETLLNEFIAEVKSDAIADGVKTEVFVLWHDHEQGECECIQYEQDHKPTYVFPTPTAVCECCGMPVFLDGDTEMWQHVRGVDSDACPPERQLATIGREGIYPMTGTRREA